MNDSKPDPLVRVKNGPDSYSFWVSEDDGVNWTPIHHSPIADRVQIAKKAWAADHPLPDPWLSDLPTGQYRLRDLDRGLTLEPADGRAR